MSDTTRQVDEEPVGIVISRGSRAEPVPVFRLYLWEPAPEGSEGATPRAAA